MARAKQVKSLSKVQSRITKKKGSGGAKALHEHSRDARSLGRAVAREEKLSRMYAERERSTQPYLERVAFFQEVQQSHPTPAFTISEIQDTIAQYLARYEDEIEEIQTDRRPGRPPPTRLIALQHQKANDEKESASGMWVPDMRDKETLEVLSNWKGDWTSLHLFKFIRVARDGTVRESKFPPKGGS